MSFKNLLVHVDATPHSDSRVAVATTLATRFSAHLTGLYVIEPRPAEIVFPTDLDYATSHLALAHARSEARESQAETSFIENLRRAALAGEWRVGRGNVETLVPHWARHMDLAIVGQSDPDDAVDNATSVATDTLLQSGRPVLIVPYAGRFETIGKTVVVAWKNTREAVRALNDALPLLQQADSVTLLAVNTPSDEQLSDDLDAGQAMLVHLSRHGVAAHIDHLDGSNLSAGDMILNRCFDVGADLIVAGGYGHSRLHDRLLGGVTRALFEHLTLPVFMSH